MAWPKGTTDSDVYDNAQPSFPCVAGEAIGRGQLVSISTSDGLAYLACAAAGTPELGALGWAETSVPSGGLVEVKHQGRMAGLTGLIPEDLVYLSNTPGGYSVTAGDTSQEVGMAYTTTKLVICIEQIASQTTQSSSSSSSSLSSSSSSSTSSSSSSSSSTGQI